MSQQQQQQQQQTKEPLVALTGVALLCALIAGGLWHFTHRTKAEPAQFTVIRDSQHYPTVSTINAWNAQTGLHYSGVVDCEITARWARSNGININCRGPAPKGPSSWTPVTVPNHIEKEEEDHDHP